MDELRAVLEIAEGVLLDDRPAALRAMQELQAMGVRIALDDFGTGYSSLSYLLRSVDILKIDASFVKGLGIDAEAVRASLRSDEPLSAADVDLRPSPLVLACRPKGPSAHRRSRTPGLS